MASSPRTSVSTLSAVGVTTPVPFQPIAFPGALQAGIIALVSSGASLTYSIEVTGDDINAPGWTPATGNWVTFTGMGPLTSSGVATLGAVVMAIRAHVTAYASGTLTFAFVQQTAD